jgi:hypothetical protein
MRLRNYDLVVVILLAVAALYVGLTETRYHLDLNRMASTKLMDMENTIGEYWTQGKVPIEYVNYEIISLGHLSYNPFVYDRPSIHLWKDPMGSPSLHHFSTRDMLPDEINIVKSFNNGDFTGFRWYLLILGVAISYMAARCLTSIRKKNKQPSA